MGAASVLEFEFAKGFLVVIGVDYWRKWPREPARNCKYRANTFFLEPILSLNKD